MQSLAGANKDIRSEREVVELSLKGGGAKLGTGPSDTGSGFLV
jgi:hypothetical protein